MPRPEVRIAVLISGGGSNLEAILQAQNDGKLGRGKVVVVVSNRADAYGLQRAQSRNVTTRVIDRKSLSSEEAFQAALISALLDAKVDVICLAGFLKKLGPMMIQKYRGRILNIHPALLPKYGGAGMYGHYVHEAVIAAGDRESGCTVHVVDEELDHGPRLAQARVPVLPGDNADRLAARVLEEEHKLYPQVIAQFCETL